MGHDSPFWTQLRGVSRVTKSDCAWLVTLAQDFHDRVAEVGADVVMEGAVESLGDWMTDPARFPPAWIVAVQDTLRQAREQARPHA